MPSHWELSRLRDITETKPIPLVRGDFVPGMMRNSKGAHGRVRKLECAVCLIRHDIRPGVRLRGDQSCQDSRRCYLQGAQQGQTPGMYLKLPHPRFPHPALSVWPGPGDPLAPRKTSQAFLPKGWVLHRGRGEHLCTSPRASASPPGSRSLVCMLP